MVYTISDDIGHILQFQVSLFDQVMLVCGVFYKEQDALDALFGAEDKAKVPRGTYSVRAVEETIKEPK